MIQQSKYQSIQLKIIVPIAISFIVSAVAIFFATLESTKASLKKELYSKGQTLATNLADNSQTVLLDQDSSIVQGLIDQYRKISGVEYVFVRNENAQFIAHTFSPQVPMQFLNLASSDIHTETTSFNEIDFHEHKILDVKVKIMNGLMGDVHVGMNLSDAISEAMRPIKTTLAIVALFTSIVGFFFLYQSIRNVTNDLEKTNIQLNSTVGELQLARAGLVKSTKMNALGEMAGGVVQEINTPLMGLVQSLEKIQKLNSQSSPTFKEMSENLLHAVSHADKMMKITRGLRTFSRDSSKDAFEEISVQKIMRDLKVLCEGRFKAQGVVLQVHEPKNDFKIECRGQQIMQVLLNMLNNSFDAVQGLGKKWVVLDAKLDHDTCEWVLTDSGEGIPKDLQQKIFQPLFTTKGDKNNAGLGLSISNSIIVAHHGEIRIDDSAVNTKFVIRIPLQQSRNI